MSGCPHEYHEREASVYVDGLCPLCMRAEIERLRAQLVSDINAETEIDRLETEIERLRKALTTIVEVLPESSTAAAIARRALEGK